MTYVVLFHSVYGPRPAVIDAAERMRAAGHTVRTPDLYAGQVAGTIDEGFALSEQIGWDTIIGRARDAMRGCPDDAALSGFSMGTGVVGGLLPERPDTAGVLLLDGVGGEPDAIRAGLPIQLHIADSDEYFPATRITRWCAGMAAAGASVTVYSYPDAGHLYTDAGTAAYNKAAADLTWQRSLAFLGDL